MKKLNSLILFLALLCVSCEEFLEEDPKGLITTDKFFKTEDDLIAAVNGIYQSMRYDVYELTPIYVPELISDDAMLPETDIFARVEIENLTYTSQHLQIRNIWSNAYTSIERANVVLAEAKQVKGIRKEVLERVWAEARFLRAFYYFRLVQLFGDTPLLLEPASVAKNNLTPVRAPEAEVYKAIIEDLQYAEKFLGDSYYYTDDKNGGRAIKFSAKALLGKVYLTMAGYPLKDVSKYQLAIEKLKEIIDTRNNYDYKLSLNNNYADIFSSSPSVKAADRERIFYTKGVSGLPSALQGFTRMKALYIGSPVLRVSSDYTNRYTFTAGTNAWKELIGGKFLDIQNFNKKSGAIPIGFNFNFGGISFSEFYASSNGWISFINRTSVSAPGQNSTPNLTATKDPLIAPLMESLNGVKGLATYLTEGTAPNRVLTVQWKNWHWKSTSATATYENTISFQVKLYEANGKFEMIYDQLKDPSNNSTGAGAGFRTNGFYCSIQNTAKVDGEFAWIASSSSYSNSIKKFQPGQIFTIVPNDKGVYEWHDSRAAVTVSSTNAVNKYNDQLTSGYSDNADDFIWLRYSDVLLMYAEALAQVGGAANMDEALSQINAIRQAHGGTLPPPSTQPALPDLTYGSQEDLINLIRLERRRELAFEGHRWYDLKRWGMLPAMVRRHLSNQYGKPESEYAYITDNMYRLPIPAVDVSNNPNIKQNNGY